VLSTGAWARAKVLDANSSAVAKQSLMIDSRRVVSGEHVAEILRSSFQHR
jgi:hypothetical protein